MFKPCASCPTKAACKKARKCKKKAKAPPVEAGVTDMHNGKPCGCGKSNKKKHEEKATTRRQEEE